MADGDITAIKQLGRIQLPGGGNTIGGVQKQNKIVVWGQITATYVSTGINLSNEGDVKALGVDNLDFLEIVVDVNSTDDNIDKDNLTLVNLDTTNDLIFALESLGQANAAAPGNADAMTLRYWAIGDAADAAELT